MARPGASTARPGTPAIRAMRTTRASRADAKAPSTRVRPPGAARSSRSETPSRTDPPPTTAGIASSSSPARSTTASTSRSWEVNPTARPPSPAWLSHRDNEGHPGWTITQITRHRATLTSALKDSPPIVLLHIGTNDLPNSLTGASDRLAQLIDQIVAALPNSLLVVAQIIPLPWAESSVVTYNGAIPGMVQARAAKGKHVIMVDMNTGFPQSGGFAQRQHPSERHRRVPVDGGQVVHDDCALPALTGRTGAGRPD